MRPGDILGDQYELVKLVGRGGMAEVWEARGLRDPRHVAVKFLRPDQDPAGFDDAEWYESLAAMRGRFRREAALMRRLRHPGIPELLGQGENGTDPYIVMRLVDGVSLHRFLERHNPTIPAAVAIAAQAADALAHVHALPVVHRDIKPYNLLIARNGTVVLIDFGIAKPVGGGATPYTRQGSTVGSRGYQAPEQILERQVTPKTDLYALGCVLYELLAGRPPFTGERLADQHLHEHPLPVQSYAPHVPAALADLTIQLLEKDPDQRPASAAIVREALSGYLPRPGEPEPSPRFEPDPTRPFREDAESWPSGAPSPADSQGSARTGRGAGWLSRRRVEAVLRAADDEPGSGELGDAAAEIAELVGPAQRQWGRTDPLARAVRKKAADTLRLAGDCGRAATFYQELADIAQQAGGTPADRADLAEGRLGAAECRIPFGEHAPAADAIRHIVGVLPELPPTAARHLAGRCREVGLELTELGHGETVGELLGQLDRWERQQGSI